MASNVEEQVVRMRFDNQGFEQNANKSISTLDKLKQALKMEGAAKGFEDLDRSINNMQLDNIAAGVEALEKKFSALGVAGMTVVANLTNGLVNTAKQAVKTIESITLTAGSNRATNIEQAQFMFKGLGMDIDKAMASANEAVSGTAYGLDAAAKAASQFGAAGMTAGDEMTKALRAIAGVAAMTGSEYENIANIFTTVSANGKLMGDQILQLSSRGLSALSALGKQLGKTEAEVKDMVSKGQIDFETFYKAMYDAFGEHAAKANETFTGALSNTKAALSRLSADFYTSFHSAARQVLNETIPVLNNVKASMTGLISAFDWAAQRISKVIQQFLKPLQNPSKELTRIFNAFGKIIKAVALVFDDFMDGVSQIGVAFGRLMKYTGMSTEGVRDFAQEIKMAAKNFKPTEEALTVLRKSFYIIMRIGYDVARVFISIGRAVGSALAETQPLLSAFGSFAFETARQVKNVFNNITKVLDNFISSAPMVNLLANGFQVLLAVAKPIIGIAYDIELSFARWLRVLVPIAEVITGGLADAILTLGNGVAGILDHIKNFADAITISREQVNQLKEAIVPVLEVLKTFFEVVRGIGQIGFTLLSGGLDILGQAFSSFMGSSGPFIDNFLGWAADLGKAMQSADFPKQVRELFDAFNEQLKNGMPSFQDIVNGVSNGFNDIRERLANGESIVSIIGEMFGNFGDKLEPVRDFASKIVETFKSMIDTIGIQIPTLDDIVGAFPEEIQQKLEPLTNIIKGIGDGLRELIRGIKEAFIPAEQTVADGVSAVEGQFDPLISIFEFFKGIIVTVVDTIGNFLGSLGFVGDAFRETFSSLGDVFGRAVDNMDYETFLNAFNSGMFAALVVSLRKFIDQFTGMAESLDVTSLAEKIGGLMDSVGDTLSAFQGKLKADVLKTIAVSIAILAGSLLLLAFIQPEALAKGLIGITTLFMGLERVFNSLSKTIAAGGIGVIKDVAVMFLGLSASVLILSFAVKKLGSLSWQELIKGLGTVSAIIGGLYVLGTKGGIKHLYTGTAQAMIMLATSMTVMAVALKILASIPYDKMLVGLGGMAGALGIVAGFAYLMEETKLDGSLAKNLVAVGSSMVILAAGLAVLSLLPAEKILTALGALGGALLIVSGAAVVLSKFATPNIAASLMGISFAILMLAPAMMMLSTLSLEGLLTALGAMAGFFAILIGAAAISETVLFGLTFLGTAVMQLGAGFMMAGLGATLFGAGLALIAVAGLPAVGVLLSLAAGVIALVPAFAVSAAGAIVAFISAIGNGAQAIATAFMQIVTAIATVLMGAIPLLIAIGLTLIDSLLMAIAAHMPSIMENGLKIVLMFMQGIEVGMPLLVEQGAQMVISFINGLSAALDEHSAELASSLGSLILSILNALGQLILGVGAGLIGGLMSMMFNIWAFIGPTLLDLGQNIVNWLIETAGSILGVSPEFIEGAKELFGKFVETAKEVVMGLPDILAGGINDALGFFGIPPIFEEKGDEAGQELASGIEESTAPEEAIEQKMNDLGEGIEFPEMDGLGEDFMAKIGEGMEGSDIDFNSLISDDLLEGVQGGESTLPDFENLGLESMTNINSGMENGPDLSTTINDLMGKAKASGSEKADEFSSIGNQAVNGMASGASSNGSFSTAIRQIVRDGLAAGKDEAEIKSPSRLFMRELGQYIPAGAAKGVTKASYMLENATKGMVDGSLNAAKESFSKYEDVLNSDLDVNPVITPVLDLSNIESGSKTISQLLASEPNYSLNGSIGTLDTSGATLTAGQINSGVTQARMAADDLSDVVGAIKKLGGKLESMEPGNSYYLNGNVMYDEGTSVATAVGTLAQELLIAGRS